MLKQLLTLSALQLRLEAKSKNGFYAVILYILSSIFIVYMATKNIDDGKLWISIFWVIQLFTCLNAASRSFQYSKGRDLYYYQLSGPRPFIISKIFFNLILMNVVFALSFFIFSLMLGNPFKDFINFYLIGALGVSGLSSLLTMMSAITFKADNNYTLMAILSLPIMIPLLIVLVQTSNYILEGESLYYCLKNILILGSLNVMNIILSYVLFPYLCTK